MIIAILAVTAGVAFGIALYKHKTLAGVEASAKKELVYLEGLAEKVAADVKADYTAAVARLKALF